MSGYCGLNQFIKTKYKRMELSRNLPRRLTQLLGALLLVPVLLSSCKQNLDPVAVEPAENTVSKAGYRVAQDGKIVLGKKLENPYTVEVMTKAYALVAAKTGNKVSESKSPVRTTHQYVRFLPKDWKQYDLLKRDTVLRLSDVPLDYEVEMHGNNYHDATVCDTCPTWQYTTVKEGHKLNPDIKNEVLAKLYIPESDRALSELNIQEKVAGKSFLDALIDEALIMTKNYGDTLKVKKPKGGRVSWNPSGTIQVWDTRLNQFIPLVGIKVQARRWFTYYIVNTNQNGYFESPWGFERPANYSLWFESWGFDVRTGTFGQAWIDRPKQSDPWNLDITGGEERFFSHVFRAAFRYHSGNIGGLMRPIFQNSLKYGAYYDAGSAQGVNIGNWSVFGINPNILIHAFNSQNQEYQSDEIFSTTCHETCHSTHVQEMNLGYVQYGQVSIEIRESWPTAVEWFITQMEYRERGIGNYSDPFYAVGSFPTRFGHQDWRPGTASTDNYSCVFIDLVDDYNQAGRFGNTGLTDNVTGYTMAGIEQGFLKHVYGYGSLRDQAKDNKPAGVTDEQIDELMNQF